MKLLKNTRIVYFLSAAYLLFFLPSAVFSMEIQEGEKLTSVIKKIAQNDPNVTSVCFWNMQCKEDKALKQLFNALENNKHVESIEISSAAFKNKNSIKLSNECIKKYNENFPKTQMSESWTWQANDAVVKVIAKALKNNTSLKTVCFKDMWIPSTSQKVLGNAFKDNQAINKLVLQIDGLNTDLALPIVTNPRIRHLDLSENPFLSAYNNGFMKFIDEIVAQGSMQTLRLKKSYNKCYGEYHPFVEPPLLDKLLGALKDEDHCLKFLDIKKDLKESRNQAARKGNRIANSDGFRFITNEQTSKSENASLKRTASEEKQNNQNPNKKSKK